MHTAVSPREERLVLECIEGIRIKIARKETCGARRTRWFQQKLADTKEFELATTYKLKVIGR
jgi:hypothetical protein